MLSEDDYDKLMQPIVSRQESINIYVLSKIADRVKEIGSLLPSDINTLDTLRKTGNDVRIINKELARLTKLQIIDIQKLIKTVAQDSYISTKPYWDYTQKPFIAFKENEQVQKTVNAIAKQTANTYTNLSKSQAFMIRDLQNPKILKPTSISGTYQSIVDEAIQAAQNGTMDYNTSMRRSMQQLIDSGIRSVQYQSESGRTHSQRLDTAVRRNLHDGIRAVNQGVQDETGKQFGADGKEITVHRYPAQDHAAVQGHQLTNIEVEKMQRGEDFTDINGRQFKGFDRAIGTLNCRHFMFSIIVGTTPNYTEQQLKEILKENEKGYTLPNGKHLTMYQCTQQQRKLESDIRNAKTGKLIAEESGDTELVNKYESKIAKYINTYKEFSKNCGLSIKGKNTSIQIYKKK